MKTFAKFVALGIVAVAAVAYAQSNDDPLAKMVGKPMPKFSMKTLEGKTLNNASLKGKVTVLDFWASWCGPCKAASPRMQELHKEFGSKGLMVVGANIWEENDTTGKNAKAYRAEHKYSYTFTYNNDKLGEKLGIAGVPAFIVIDRKGKVRDTMQGYDHAAMKALVKKLIAEK